MGDRAELDTVLERWRKRGWDRNSVVADPQLRLDDPLHFDALVQGGPAAHKLGFRAIDTSDLGPRQNRSGFLKLSEGVRQGR